MSKRVLIVEDDYLIAAELVEGFKAGGLEVAGPVGTLKDALAYLESENDIDAAVLDIDLGGQAVYPVADELIRRGIPFVFATGYDDFVIPARYLAFPRYRKPVHPHRLSELLTQIR
jgi:DNA-binding LytR/AlgR family response regulator